MAAFVPVVRSASLHGYVDLARASGLDPMARLRRAGILARSLEDPDTPLPVDAVRQLLEASADASGVEDFGLRLASRRQLSNLGPISLVLREEPDGRAALDTLCRYLRLLNASLLTRIEEENGLVVIREDILMPHSVASTRQSMELAVGVMHRILRELLGPSWRPLRASFMHRAPHASEPHQAFFGAPVDFNQAFNGLVCRASDLRQPLRGANPEMARFARRYLDGALSQERQGAPSTVRQLVAALLPGGRCTAQQVAQHLGIDRRTLHRHLAQEGTSFSDLLQSVRAELGLRQVQDSDQPLSEIAALLGYSAPSAFAHWFQTRFGCSASEYRRARAASAAA